MRLMDVFTKLEQQEVLETLIQFQTTFMVGGGIIILCSHDFEKLFHSTLTSYFHQIWRVRQSKGTSSITTDDEHR